MEEQLNRLLVENSELKRSIHNLTDELSRKSRETLRQQDSDRSQAELRQYESRFDLLMQ
jgi:hypothetical protein